MLVCVIEARKNCDWEALEIRNAWRDQKLTVFLEFKLLADSVQAPLDPFCLQASRGCR
mgnify:CR=1 FL=1